MMELIGSYPMILAYNDLFYVMLGKIVLLLLYTIFNLVCTAKNFNDLFGGLCVFPWHS